jgi:hypothetical protein
MDEISIKLNDEEINLTAWALRAQINSLTKKLESADKKHARYWEIKQALDETDNVLLKLEEMCEA